MPKTGTLVSEVLGRRLQNDAYRQLLLQVISNQWVEYLTQVEALRIQVGMERYGQRDPLVQYKSKATDMFKDSCLKISASAWSAKPLPSARGAVAVEGSASSTPAQSTQQAPQSTAKTQKETQAALIPVS